MVEDKLWYTSGSGRVELEMTWEQANIGSHQGECDADVKYLSQQPDIAKQLATIDPAELAKELRECGAWDDVELADHVQNLQRILWLACGDIIDENFYRREL